jgi:hypothetical protein
VEAGLLHATIGHMGALDDVGLDVGGQGVAGAEVVVRLGTPTAAATTVVVVDADENGVVVAVSSSSAFWRSRIAA